MQVAKLEVGLTRFGVDLCRGDFDGSKKNYLFLKITRLTLVSEPAQDPY